MKIRIEKKHRKRIDPDSLISVLYITAESEGEAEMINALYDTCCLEGSHMAPLVAHSWAGCPREISLGFKEGFRFHKEE